VSDYVLYDEAGIVERCGVRPDQYVDYAALRGDPSDNLPGVPGVGEKTAATLLQRFGDIEGIFDHLGDLTPRLRQNLEQGRERVFQNRQLTVLRRDVEVGVEPGELRRGEVDREAIRTLFTQLAFRGLQSRLEEALGPVGGPTPGVAPEPGGELDVAVEVVADAGRAETILLDALASPGPVALEGRFGGAPGRSPLLGVALTFGSGAVDGRAEGWYLPAPLLEDVSVAKALGRLVASGEPMIVAHRAKDLMLGIPSGSSLPICELRGPFLDTAVAAYLLDPADGRYVLEDVARRYADVELGVAPGPSEGTLDLDGDAGATEAVRRAVVVARLAPVVREALVSRELSDLYDRVERPLVRVLARMESAGVRVDLGFLRQLGGELVAERDALEARICAAAGEVFNVNSTPQLRRILFEKLGLTPVKKTKTGASTDADSLSRLLDEHPIIEPLLRYREVEKLRSTYADALPPLVGGDGRIHAVLNQTVAATGRISCESPNLQNIPLRTAAGREIRRAFIAAEGCRLLVADYSQIELRVLAHLARDPGLVEAFAKGEDVHAATAAGVFGTSIAEVTPEQRRFAKVVNYGLAYGMEAFGLASRLGVATDVAREVLDAYFASFPRMRAFMEETVAEARERGYTTTVLGRRRQLPELSSNNFRIRQMGERMALNAPVQGSAADIFKLAMIGVDRRLEELSRKSRMVLTVHDEVVLEVPEEELDEVTLLVRETMESAYRLSVPLEVAVHSGITWADAKG
ncbi:MAG: DNA polymerase I, partial [Acidimicrobiia bacterium]